MNKVDEMQLFEDTINLDEVVESGSLLTDDATPFDINTLPQPQTVVEFEEAITLQNKTMQKINGLVEDVKQKSIVKGYIGVLAFIAVVCIIAMIYFMVRKDSVAIFLSIVLGAAAVIVCGAGAFEGYRFFKIQKHLETMKKPLVETSAMNHQEKVDGLSELKTIQEMLNGITLLTSFIGTEITAIAEQFQSLRCISYEDKMHIIESQKTIKSINQQIEKDLDQDSRFRDEINEVYAMQQGYEDELFQLNEDIKQVPTLKNDFGIALEKYNNLGGETLEQMLNQDWKQKIDEATATLAEAKHERESLDAQLAEERSELEKSDKYYQKELDGLVKQKKKLEQEKQNTMKKVEHAQQDFEKASQNLVEANRHLHDLKARLATESDDEKRKQLLHDVEQTENQVKKHQSVSEKARIFVDTTSVIDIDLKVSQLQSEIVGMSQQAEEKHHYFETEINKIQTDLNLKIREVAKGEEILEKRQLQRQEALRPFQEQVEIMVNLNNQIRDILERKREVKPSLEAKIIGVSNRLENLNVEKSALVTKITDQQNRVDFITQEIVNLSNNFID